MVSPSITLTTDPVSDRGGAGDARACHNEGLRIPTVIRATRPLTACTTRRLIRGPPSSLLPLPDLFGHLRRREYLRRSPPWWGSMTSRWEALRRGQGSHRR